ncbi:MAG TPA: methylated-DNA--[protein]-cysteine S-methyltransferase [Rhodothermales bacterium]|nr:methylated-DNA--[protein]-cysteine S-methyltransferase [Rhodothermales bacterium]
MPAYTVIASPVGPLTLSASKAGLQEVRWGDVRPADAPETPHHPVLQQAITQLTEFFDGERTTFDVPLEMQGTPFQKSVWDLLLTIPYGETTTYGALAETLGDPGKARAVGLANGKNPISIIVPCHRVIGSSGALTGFGGGLDRKAFLLRLERRVKPPVGAQADLFAG